MTETPRAHDLLVFSHDPDAMPSLIYQSELGLGKGMFLVCDMFSDRYLVIPENDAAGRRKWKTVSEPGTYPSGNTWQARSRAIEQAVQYMASKQTETLGEAGR